MTSLVHSTRPFASRRAMVRISVLAVAIAALFAIAFAAQAKAAPAVGNPGAFTATWDTGQMSQGNVAWPLSTLGAGSSPLILQLNVDANGNITMPNPSFRSIPVPGSYERTDSNFFTNTAIVQNISVQPQATSAWTGSINPLTGQFNLSAPMKWSMSADTGGNRLDSSPCNINSVTNVNTDVSQAGGVPYSISAGIGHVTTVDRTFSLPGSNDCRTKHNKTFGGTTTNDANAVTNSFFGLPQGSGASSMVMGLTITPAIKPWPVRAELSISPDPVGAGRAATLDASASIVEDGVKPCAVPSPAEPNCGYRWDFDNNGSIDEVTNTATTTHAYPTAGTKTSAVTIYDLNGKASDPATATVVVQTEPVAQIDSAPGTTKEVTSPFTFSIPSNIYNSTPECRVDGGSWAPCTSGDDVTVVQASDTSGAHAFDVRGVTPEGVTGPTATHNWTVDRVLPRVTIAPGSKPADPTQDTSANFQLTADKSGSSMECQIDSGSWDACGTNSVGSQAYSGLDSDPAVQHTFKVRATDPLGNIGGDANPGGAEFQWTVDLEAPIVTFASTPTDPSSNTSPSFSWTNSDNVNLGNNGPISSAQCRLDRGIGNGAWGPCDGLTTSQVHNLQDGTYHFKVRTIDIAGNFSPVATYTWAIETVNPNLEITRAPAVNAKRSVAVFEYVYEAGSTATCQIDSKPVQDPCTADFGPGAAPGTEKGKISYDFLAEGPHTFSVTVEDIAANTTTQVYMWNVKTVQPLLSIDPGSYPDATALDGNASFVLTTNNGDAQCQLDGNGWNACDSNSAQDYTNLSDGYHTFEAKATDASGNESATDGYSWLVLKQAPQITFNSTPAANTNQTTAPFAYTVNSADPGIQTTCSLDGGGMQACSSPTILTALADGAHTFDVTATDAAGTMTVASYAWNVKAKIPGLGFNTTPAAHSNSAAANFAFSSDEDPNVAYDCSLDSAAWSSCSSPKSLSGLSNGNHNFRIRATDSVTNAAVEGYDWNVDTATPTVTYTQKPDASTTNVAELVKFNASESGATFSCQLDSAAAGSCSSPYLLEDLSIGSHSLKVHAVDQAGNVGPDNTASWTINAVPAATVGGNSVLRTQAACPAGLGSNCTVVVQAFTSKSGKPVSKKHKVKVKAGKRKRIKLKQKKAKSGKVVIRQRIRSGKKHQTRYSKTKSSRFRG